MGLYSHLAERGSVPRQKPKALSTDATLAGGPVRSSCEAPAHWRWGWSQGTGSSGLSIRSTVAFPRRKRGNMPTSQVKPFDIPKQQVWEAYRRVAANKGAPGVDGQTLDEFESDLKGNLYKIWNRMSSGSYFPPPVKGVEIPKPHGGGVHLLGVPCVSDRVAQTVVARRLEGKVEAIFHSDSYGYRPGRSPEDAVEVCQRRCWKRDWVIDLDIEKFFDSVPRDLIVKAVEANTDLPWVVLYVTCL